MNTISAQENESDTIRTSKLSQNCINHLSTTRAKTISTEIWQQFTWEMIFYSNLEVLNIIYYTNNLHKIINKYLRYVKTVKEWQPYGDTAQGAQTMHCSSKPGEKLTAAHLQVAREKIRQIRIIIVSTYTVSDVIRSATVSQRDELLVSIVSKRERRNTIVGNLIGRSREFRLLRRASE